MASKSKINKLLSNMPNDGKFDLEREREISNTVGVSGELRGRDGDFIVVKSGSKLFFVLEKDIEDVEELPDRPHLPNAVSEVSIKVRRGSIIKVISFLDTEVFSSQVGARPLVYDIPSRAGQYTISGEEFDAAHQAWMQATGLGDFERQVSPNTFSTTYYPTYRNSPRQTPRQTPRSTGTDNNDTQTDYSTDYSSDDQTDSFSDPQMDMD